jgi:hypothetical protein
MKKQITIKDYEGKPLDLHNIYDHKFKGEEIGRKDINGVPIKEGDIVLVHDHIDLGGIITYNENGCGFCFDSGDMSIYTFSWGWGESL